MAKSALLAVSCALLIVFCMFEATEAAASDSWSTEASMNHARAYLGVATVNGKIYAIGGDEGSETGNASPGTAMTNNAVNYTEEYNPAQNVWTAKADMPTKRALFGTAVYGGKIYCIGGYNGANIFIGPESWNWKTEYYDVNANEAYDVATDAWQVLAPLPTARHAAATNVVDGKIYVIGGYTMANMSATLNINEVYDPSTNSWATKTAAPLSVTSVASVVVDNKIYVLGNDPYAYLQRNLMIYDPATDTWTVKGKTPVGYAATAAATTGANALKRIYYFDANRTDIYDPVADTWITGTPAPTTNKLIASATALDDAIYLIGGRSGEWGYMVFMYPSNVTEKYLPIGYGAPDTTTPSPSPNSTDAPSATPAEGTPQASQTIKQEPESTPELTILPIAGALIAVTAVCLAIAVWRKPKRSAA